MPLSKIDSDSLNSGAVTSTALASGVPTRAQMPVGSVLQVVQGTFSTETETSSSTYADTGLTASITPSSASSKILVLVTMQGCGKGTNDTALRIRTLRGATVIDSSLDIGYTGSSATNYVGSVSVNILDSPATTSATTYKTQFMSQTNVAKARICSSNSTSYITLMEIAA
jgi:hypothetical protein